MYKTFLAAVVAVALGMSPAFAHTTGKPHEHPHNQATETLIDAVDAAAACVGGVTLDDLREAAMEAETNIIILEGDTLAAFAQAVMDKFGVPKPDDILKIIVPDFFKTAADPVMVAHIDANDCMSGQSAWDRSFMASVFQEADFAAKD